MWSCCECEICGLWVSHTIKTAFVREVAISRVQDKSVETNIIPHASSDILQDEILTDGMRNILPNLCWTGYSQSRSENQILHSDLRSRAKIEFLTSTAKYILSQYRSVIYMYIVT